MSAYETVPRIDFLRLFLGATRADRACNRLQRLFPLTPVSRPPRRSGICSEPCHTPSLRPNPLSSGPTVPAALDSLRCVLHCSWDCMSYVVAPQLQDPPARSDKSRVASSSSPAGLQQVPRTAEVFFSFLAYMSASSCSGLRRWQDERAITRRPRGTRNVLLELTQAGARDKKALTLRGTRQSRLGLVSSLQSPVKCLAPQHRS